MHTSTLALTLTLSLAPASQLLAQDASFGMQQLPAGYQLAAAEVEQTSVTRHVTDDAKTPEGKCGEGKCGADKTAPATNTPAATESDKKSHEGTCGASKKAHEGNCGAAKPAP